MQAQVLPACECETSLLWRILPYHWVPRVMPVGLHLQYIILNLSLSKARWAILILRLFLYPILKQLSFLAFYYYKGNILNKVPQEAQSEMKAYLNAVSIMRQIGSWPIRQRKSLNISFPRPRLALRTILMPV
jgi:hypothetical protein